VLRIPNVSGKSFDASDLKFAELSPREETELSLEPGDLLMIRSNGSVQLLGKSMLVPDTAAGMAYAGYLMRLRPDPLAIDARYLEIALASPAVRNQIEIPVRSTSGVHNINTDEVRGLGIPLPPLPEQLEVTSRAVNLLQRVTSIQQQIERAAASVGRTSQAALSKAFRGELVAATDQ
jgi:type I restriction enzyme S subunit